MKQRIYMSLLFPLLAVLTIIGFAGGLGIVFIVLNKYILEEWAVIILGVTMVVAVPATAAILQRITDDR